MACARTYWKMSFEECRAIFGTINPAALPLPWTVLRAYAVRGVVVIALA